MSSWGHHYSPVIFEDPNFERREYGPFLAYGPSKTANILFAVALDERGKAAGARTFSLHPGTIVGTGLAKYLSIEGLRARGVIDERGSPVHDVARGLKTIEQGAATSVWCATSPQLNGMGGVYCEDVDVARVDDPATILDDSYATRHTGVMPYAIDPEAAERLWSLSEQLLVLVSGAKPLREP